MRIRAIILLIIIIVLGGFFWVYNHSFITIVATGGVINSKYRYEIKDQTSEKTQVITTDKPSIRRLVTKGDYQVMVTNDKKSSVSFVQTKSLLRVTKTSPQLSNERDRTYIGKSPGFCTYYKDVLYSYDCNSNYSSLKTHMAAAPNTPTYTKNASELEEALLKGIFTIDDQPYTLTETGSEAYESGVTKLISPLRSDLTLQGGVAVDNLNSTKSYGAVPYKNGALLYSNDLREITLLQGSALTTKSIPAPKPEGDATQPVGATAYQNQFGLLFNSAEGGGDEGLHSTNEAADEQTGESAAIIYTDEQKPAKYSFKKFYSSMRLCGENILCGVASGKLDVYKLQKKPQLLFSMTDVQTTVNSGEKLIVATNKATYSIDVATQQGAIDYSYGAYSFCGIESNADAYTLCILDADNISNELYINPSVDDGSSIDKKIETLNKLPQVTSISAFGDYIHISQYTGQLVYDAEQRGYIPDQATINQITARINEVIDEIGIDRSKYTTTYNY